MKKFGVVILLALVGGGAYLYFQEPEKFKELTDKVENLIAGANWLKLDQYGKDFTKKGLTQGDEKEGYLGRIQEKLTLNEYNDSETGSVLIANDGKDAVALYFTFSETADGDILKVSKEQWKHFFGKEVEFLDSGEAEGEYALGSWETKGGNITIFIHHKSLELIPTVDEMEPEVQTAVSDFRDVVKQKVSMEKRWEKLGDEKHFCFDANRFKEIVSEMDSLKKQSEELTKKAKELIGKIPQAQVALIRKELDGASFE